MPRDRNPSNRLRERTTVGWRIIAEIPPSANKQSGHDAPNFRESSVRGIVAEQSRQWLAIELVAHNRLQRKLVAVRGQAESNPDLPFEVLEGKGQGGENQVLLEFHRRHFVERGICRVILDTGLEMGHPFVVNASIEVKSRNAAGVRPGRGERQSRIHIEAEILEVPLKNQASFEFLRR